MRNRLEGFKMNDFLKGGNFRKFTVLKNADIKKYLEHEDRLTLAKLIGKIQNGRIEDGKNPNNTYLVINTDEKYAPKVVEILKRNGHWG